MLTYTALLLRTKLKNAVPNSHATGATHLEMHNVGLHSPVVAHKVEKRRASWATLLAPQLLSLPRLHPITYVI